MNTDSNTILTVKDVQTIFGCGKNQAYEIVHTNGFLSFQTGRRLYVCKKSFFKWLDKNKSKVIFK